MSESILVNYTIEPKLMLHAMVQTGQSLMKRYQVVMTAFYMLSVILICTGAAAVASAIAAYVTEDRSSIRLIAFLGALAGAVFHLYFQQWPYRIMARFAAGSKYGRGPQQALFDREGITFSNATSKWKTSWAGVEDIHLGKDVFTFRVAAIAFMLPRSAVDEPDALLAQLNTWKSAG